MLITLNSLSVLVFFSPTFKISPDFGIESIPNTPDHHSSLFHIHLKQSKAGGYNTRFNKFILIKFILQLVPKLVFSCWATTYGSTNYQALTYLDSSALISLESKRRLIRERERMSRSKEKCKERRSKWQRKWDGHKITGNSGQWENPGRLAAGDRQIRRDMNIMYQPLAMVWEMTCMAPQSWN